MNITKRNFLGAAAGAAMAGGLAMPAVAKAPRVLKISHQWPAYVDFRDVLCRKFAAEVEKRTNGALKFQIYPGASLFRPNQQFDAMASGALDMAVYVLAYSGGKLPPVNITLMPAMLESYAQGYGWENAAIGQWLTHYLDGHGVDLVTWIWQGGGSASRDKPILVPADVKGLKVRGAGKMIELMLQSAGASISTFPSTETYNAMRSGVVDALWTTSASLMSFRLQEVAKDVTTARKYTFFYSFNPLLMSRDTLHKLDASEQKVMMEVGHEMQSFALAACKADDQKVADVFGKAGVHVYDLDRAHFLEWKKLAERSAWKDFARQVKDGQKLIDMAQSVAA
ncbi:MAG: TRAP transporter substrate-binding protein DctP [Acetobacteraceae bacterium]